MKKRCVLTWNAHDVQHWLQRHHPSYYRLYGENFRENDITGKVLVQLTTLQLEQMGITNEKHRVDIFEKLMKLRLENDQKELTLLIKAKAPKAPKVP
ncbi:putative sterile alpha motif domain-containing protein 12 isoform X2 [Apostichopus japonicus]|uniref:Putative sterile alpha motif domain-containing protein 12 isoform X2 n=1 Tax=Stichopus japonicus TaxID=307972 RepID=A0A2G8JAV9_STIJA|nr:putative sterile alpha motif domain-containing protein 12 isoform X2 [Apostichopus japonicus]